MTRNIFVDEAENGSYSRLFFVDAAENGPSKVVPLRRPLDLWIVNKMADLELFDDEVPYGLAALHDDTLIGWIIKDEAELRLPCRFHHGRELS